MATRYSRDLKWVIAILVDTKNVLTLSYILR